MRPHNCNAVVDVGNMRSNLCENVLNLSEVIEVLEKARFAPICFQGCFPFTETVRKCSAQFESACQKHDDEKHDDEKHDETSTDR